jgi:hypothetical protein
MHDSFTKNVGELREYAGKYTKHAPSSHQNEREKN